MEDGLGDGGGGDDVDNGGGRSGLEALSDCIEWAVSWKDRGGSDGCFDDIVTGAAFNTAISRA